MDDQALLRDFTSDRSEAAFAALVERYVNLVWSAARRQVRDAALADEIASAVFLVLAQKSGSLRNDTILSAWLLRTTRFVAANALRREMRRQSREEEVMNTLLHRSESDAAWHRIAPLLDEALAQLADRDRDALALRFFDQRSFRDIGQALGTTDDSAQKRVSRALEKLRAYFAQHGAKVPTAILSAALTDNCVQAAPAGLAASVTAAAKGAVAGGILPALAQSAVEALAWMRLKTLAWRGAVALGTATAVLWFAKPNATPTAETHPPQRIASAKQGPTPAIARPKSTASTAAAALPTADQLLFRVLDAESGNPVPNAALTLVEITTFPRRSTNHFTTDRAGIARLPRPSVEVTNWNYRLEVSRDSYVPKYVSWSFAQGDLFADFPREHTTRLQRGTEIGGVVTGELSEPVAGALVVFSAPGTSALGTERERLAWMGSYHTEVTDAQGRWRCDRVPTNFGVINYRLVHPDYQETTYYTDAPESSIRRAPSVAKAALAEQSAVMIMKPGITVAGFVVNEAGKPIVGAKVTQDHYFAKRGSVVSTDARGRFQFRNAISGKLNLTIASNGYAPTNHLFQVQPANNEFSYTLPAGRVLRGLVVDETGKPVPDARITTGPSPRNAPTIDWQGRTDSTGRFEWLAAPAYQEAYVAMAMGFATQTNSALRTDGTEQLITLQVQGAGSAKFVRFAGQVTDAETGQPLERFEVLTARPLTYIGLTSATNRLREFGDLTVTATGNAGHYNFLMEGSLRRFVSEVRAEGYLPVRTTNACGQEASVTLNFSLRKAAPVRGVVRSTTGEPIADATVVLATERAFLPLESGGRLSLRNFRPQNGSTTTTSAEGTFSLNAQLDMQWLVAVHPSGIAELRMSSPRSDYSLVLQPWGRVEGELKLGTNTTGGLKVKLHSPQWTINPESALSPYYRTDTQADGRFSFEFVPPGTHSVSFEPHFPIMVGLAPDSHTVRVTMQPGATAHVRLGGTGRAVIGRVLSASLGREVNWLQDIHRLTSTPEFPQELSKYPNSRDFATRAAYGAAVNLINEQRQAFTSSPAGRAEQRNRREYVLLFNADGSFRVDDVLPGSYDLIISPRVTSTNRYLPHGPSFGSVVKTVVVPGVVGTDASPVDLGGLELKPAPLKKQ